MIDRFVRELTPPPGEEPVCYEVTGRGTYVALWERRRSQAGPALPSSLRTAGGHLDALLD